MNNNYKFEDKIKTNCGEICLDSEEHLKVFTIYKGVIIPTVDANTDR